MQTGRGTHSCDGLRSQRDRNIMGLSVIHHVNCAGCGQGRAVTGDMAYTNR
ncbi:hypothetical protein [Komagataeibacter europaeus]|uniref:hypothetical protein n=1 Tax=Komagataeibacter europaeus TaxID=33995 RepID=UPI00031991F1|nr:hypothetical protein [Komagataeibacter europaeus]GBQ47608.1 hypothetical protein AA18890_2802 [Komagataeibacter europaeus LMG 18890]